jgi:hypothetical protein
MKVFLFLLLFLPITAFADVYLVCAPVTPSTTNQSLNPVSYTISGLGSASVTTPATTNANGTIQLNYDLTTAGVANGSYTVTATCTNSQGFSSAASAPFTFVLPVNPAAPAALSLSPQ